MIPNGVKIEIGEKQYNLIYTVAAAEQIIGRYGSTTEMIQGIGVKDIVVGKNTDGTEKTEQRIDEKTIMREVPWIVALLANQGIMIESHNTKPDNSALLTPECVKLFSPLYALKDMINGVMEAIRIGSDMDYKGAQNDGPKDVILEELEKNAPAAGR